jgi:hypothetical protein
MSQREYARHRRVPPSAVQKAIRAGRIGMLPDGSIDSETADTEWNRFTTRHARPITNGEHDDEGNPLQEISAYSKARTVREQYQARLAKLDFEERAGRLVSKEDVENAAFEQYRQFRDQIMNIPSRIAAIVAGESNPTKVYEILEGEFRTVLNKFADGCGSEDAGFSQLTTTTSRMR